MDCTQNNDKQWICKRNARPCKDVLHKVLDSAAAKVKANCKDEALSSYGATKNDDKAAEKEAISGWTIDTSKRYGKDWADWDKAGGTDIDCHKVGGGMQCIAVNPNAMQIAGCCWRQKEAAAYLRPPLLFNSARRIVR